MKKRVFAAVDVSAEVRRKVSAYINNLRQKFPRARAGWDKPEKLHLTMKFLGEVQESQLENFLQAVEKTANKFAPFKLQICGTGVFPSTKQARVLWLGVTGEEAKLRELHNILEKNCADYGFAPEKRIFKAHLTIARLKEKSAELADAHLKQNFEPIEFEVSELIVYQSELRPTGSIYSVISIQKFKYK